MSADHLPPLVPSAQLCGRALAGQIEWEATRPGRPPGRGKLREASAYIDYALSLPAANNSAEDHFDTAQQLLHEAVDTEGVSFQTVFSATLLDIYLPAFEAAQARDPLDPEEIADMRGELARLVDAVQRADLEEGAKRGLAHRLFTPLVLARAGVEFLPSLCRETFPSDRALRPQAHDGRATLDGTQVPVRGRSREHRRSERGPGICLIPLSRIVAAAHPDIREASHGRPDLVDAAVLVLRGDAKGELVTRKNAVWLEDITERVQTRIRHFQKYGDAQTPLPSERN